MMRLVLIAGFLSTCGPPPRARPPLEEVPIGIESSRTLPPPGPAPQVSEGTPGVVPDGTSEASPRRGQHEDEGVPDLSDIAPGMLPPGAPGNPLQQLMPEGGAAGIGDILQ